MKTNSRKTATEILNVVSQVSGIPVKKIKSVSRKGDIALARGVYFLLCREEKIIPRLSGKAVCRTREASSIQGRKYKAMQKLGYSDICELVESCKELISF